MGEKNKKHSYSCEALCRPTYSPAWYPGCIVLPTGMNSIVYELAKNDLLVNPELWVRSRCFLAYLIPSVTLLNLIFYLSVIALASVWRVPRRSEISRYLLCIALFLYFVTNSSTGSFPPLWIHNFGGQCPNWVTVTSDILQNYSRCNSKLTEMMFYTDSI